MIEIPEPPDVGACGRCARALRWMWSHRRGAWVAFVPTDDPLVIRYHDHPPQDPTTWKSLSAVPDPDQAARNAAGRQAVEQALKNKERTEEKE